MKKGDKIEMGNGFVFHITGENQGGLSWFGSIVHRPTSLVAVGQTTFLKSFIEKFNKISTSKNRLK